MGKLSKNFDYMEFRPRGAAKNWMPTSEYQKMLLIDLVKNIQLVRCKMPKSSYIIVTSGVRSMLDYERLVDAGYNPSPTSDHFFGTSVTLRRGSRKIKTFGNVYNFSVGAADCVPIGMPVNELFNLAVNMDRDGECEFGQIIYERNGDGSKEWIHFGGCADHFFSPLTMRLINKEKYLMSINNGKTYTVV